MAVGGVTIIFMFFHLLLRADHSSSHPLCTDLRAPFTPKTPLSFCQYSGSVCCNSTDDLQLQNQFKAINVSDSGCASLLKSVLCSRCDQFSAELYRIELKPRTVPVLCNSTVSVNSTQSQHAAVDFCSKVWDECQNVSISNSPLALQGGRRVVINSNSKLTDLWQSKSAFCNEFGGGTEDELVCFDGGPVLLNNSKSESPPPSGICLEKVGNGGYINMVAHPDGSNRVFLSTLEGKIWLATVPEEGSGGTLQLNGSDPFLDLTNEVRADTELGMLGIAFHPNFLQNGRFFVSFNCDKVQWPGCSGRCSCNSDVGCDPSKLGRDSGAQPCQYQSVIAEFTANGTTSQPSLEEFEEVNIVTKGGNYRWRVYEGPFLYDPPTSPGGNTSASSIDPIFPIMGYNHSKVDKARGSASITGGYIYRSLTDPCLYGKYIYTDLYAGAVWVGTEHPQNSGNFTSTKVPFNCSGDSPIQCDTEPGSPIPSLGYITSFGQDNNNDIYFLSGNGVYRIVRPIRCNCTCSKENVTTFTRPGSFPIPSPSQSAAGRRLQSNPLIEFLLVIFSSFLLWS